MAGYTEVSLERPTTDIRLIVTFERALCILLELDHVQPIDERMEEPDSPEELITVRSTARSQAWALSARPAL
jgi:hypothetical protein